MVTNIHLSLEYDRRKMIYRGIDVLCGKFKVFVQLFHCYSCSGTLLKQIEIVLSILEPPVHIKSALYTNNILKIHSRVSTQLQI